MPPKVGQNKVNQNQDLELKPTVKKPVKQDVPIIQQPPTDKSSHLIRKFDLSNYGLQQKDRIESLYGAGSSAVSTFRDKQLGKATTNANYAYARTYKKELKALADPTSSTNPPKSLIDVAKRAETAYRNELSKAGFTPADVRGTSVVKAADFLRSQAKTSGDFTTLSADQIRLRLSKNQETGYFVRILDKNHLERKGVDGQLSRGESPHTWVATPEEISGAKLDTYETMKRVGYSDDYINWIKGEVADGKKNLSDFTLVVTEARGTNGKTPPSWDTIIDRAKTQPELADFNSKPKTFWDDVRNLDFKNELPKFNADKTGYLKSLSSHQQDVFKARQGISSYLGVNEYFTNDGRTARTDGKNGTYGVREFLVENTDLKSMQRNTFVELGETGKTNLQTVDKAPIISDNPLRLRSEMKTGAIGGAIVSGVTSLPQVFDQARNGDFIGAGKTLVTNTGGGAVVGGLSSGAERIVGRSIENQIAARSTSTLFSGTSGSVARQIAGRISGAGIVGGVVNGGFAAYDQINAYKRGEVTGSQAIGTVVGESAVGVGAGLAGAAAGAAIGSIIPVAGTAVGAVIGFGVGVVAGWAADKALRYGGVDKMIAKGVTAAIDKGMEIGSKAVQAGKAFVGQQIQQAKQVARAVSNGAKAAYTYVNNKVSQVKQAVTAKVNQARQYVGQKVAQVKQKLSNGAKAAVQFVSQAKKQVVQQVNRAVTAVKSTVNNAVNTVKSTVNNAKQAVSNFASNAVGGLKSVFGW
jgi:hypothetical protein